MLWDNIVLIFIMSTVAGYVINQETLQGNNHRLQLLRSYQQIETYLYRALSTESYDNITGVC